MIKVYNKIAEELAKQYNVVSGQMFGKPCLKIGKKAFAAYYQDEIVFKLGRVEINLIKEKYLGSVNWDPSGKNRAMKDWLQIPEEFSDNWMQLAIQAMENVEEKS